MRIRLNESSTVVADASGNAIARLSPQVAGSSWEVRRMITAIPSMSPRAIADLKVYMNTITEANRLDASSSAAQDSSETNIPVNTTDVIIGVYSGIPIGAACTLTVTGYKETGRY